LVCPSVEGVLVRVDHVGYFKSPLKLLQKLREEKIFVNTLFYFMRQLIENLRVFNLSKCRILVVIPLVMEILFNLALKSIVKVFMPIELYEHPEKLVELIALFDLIIIRFELRENGLVLAHNVRKNGDSKEQDHRYENPFKLAPWVIVSKTHRRQRCEHVVSHNNCYLRGRMLIERVIANEILWLKFVWVFKLVIIDIVDEVLHDFASHIEAHANDITNVYDDDGQEQSLQCIPDKK
jgi:hypothetical protein